MRFSGIHRISPFRIIVIGFVSAILLGTLLLSLPVSTPEAGSAGFWDCLFTSTSAVCVTGLAVRDTGSCWAPFGQAVILLLIQIGGMGVVTATVSLAFLAGRRIGLLERTIMQESISAPQVGGIVRLTRFVILSAFCAEAAGAALLLPAMIPAFGFGKGVWYSVFHSVSAFCNAGFDLMGANEPFSSLTAFRGNALVNCTVILLITSGGIGFLVWDDIREHGFRWKSYRLQSRVALLTSLVMILVPALWFFLYEFRTLAPGQRVLPALFQSVTLRTAGFNTVDFGGISESGRAMMILWMLVGGSPGSTAGGMKTTTAAVLLASTLTVFRRKDDVRLLGRRLPDDTVRNAVAVLVMYALLFFASGAAISAIERLPLLTCLFESASALGTVGLTLGITGSLSLASRLILILLMFLGRVGGLTVIYAAQSGKRGSFSTLPLEKITVG